MGVVRSLTEHDSRNAEIDHLNDLAILERPTSSFGAFLDAKTGRLVEGSRT